MRLIDWVKELLESIKEWPEKIMNLLNHFGRHGASNKDEEEAAEDKTIPIDHLPALDQLDQQAEPLPTEARQILSPVPLGGGSKLFAGREKEIKAFGKAMEHWQQARREMVALVGPDGCGRTTLLKRLQSDVVVSDHVTPISFNERLTSQKELIRKFVSAFELLQDCDSLDDLIVQLSQLKRQVVLIDDIHYLILRTPESAEVIRSFLSILLATQDRFLWVISCKKQAWRRLDYLYNLSRNFTNVIELSYFNKEEFMTALGMRLEACGVSLAIPPNDPAEGDPVMDPLPENKDDDTVKETVAHGFFQDLYKLSHGNIHAALFYWKYFTRYDETKAAFMVLPIREIDASVIKDLDRRHLFALGELLLHGRLTLQEHADIFQRDLLTTRLSLDFLSQHRFVEKVMPESTREIITYQVDPVFYIPVASVLESAHILY